MDRYALRGLPVFAYSMAAAIAEPGKTPGEEPSWSFLFITQKHYVKLLRKFIQPEKQLRIKIFVIIIKDAIGHQGEKIIVHSCDTG